MSNSSSSSSSSSSTGKIPQDPHPHPHQSPAAAHSSPTALSHELTPRLGFQSTSPGPFESAGPAAAAGQSGTAQSGTATARKRKRAQLGEEAISIINGGDNNNNNNNIIAISIGDHQSLDHRRQIAEQVIIGIEDDDDEHQDEDDIVSGNGKEESTVNLHVYTRRRSIDQNKNKGKLIIIDDQNENVNVGGDEGGASRTGRVMSYQGKLGKEKVIHIVDSDSDSEPEPEPVMVTDSNPDFGVSGELMEHMQVLVKAFLSSLAQHLQVQPQPHREIPHDQEMVDIPPSPRREQRRNRAKQLAPAFARFVKQKGEAAIQDDIPMPNGPSPFSKAMDKVKERAAMIGEDDNIPWIPSNEIHCGLLGLKMLTCKEIALMNLAQHAEAITSLAGIPNDLRNHLSFVLCRARKMSINLLTMLMEGKLTDLKLSDCSWASEKDFQDAFANFDKSNLEVLELDRCGRCMPDSVVHSTLSCGLNSLPKLQKLSLKGHYSLSDKGLAAIVSSAPLLNSLNLSQCSLLTTKGIINLIDKQALLLKELYVDECQNVNAMSLLPSLKKVKTLEVLSTAGIPSVSNEFVHELIPVCGSTIRELNFADCDKLTSSAIKVIGEHCPNLLALDIRKLTELKDSAIAHLANGCRAIQKLQLCRSSFSDEVIAAFVRASGEQLVELSLNKVAKVGNLTAIAIADVCRFHLKKLDLSFCYHMDDNALGTIVDRCSSLKTLKLFGCSQVTDLFLKGYFNRSVRILGVNGISLDYIEIPDQL